ncbi:MAG: glycosyltransferase family 2 protein [Bacteroidales bacterium]|nr:glycosyltransferase family 2 protein [Bacteroidales bacterium]
MKVAVVILNWNGKALLEQFLPTVIEHTPDYAEVIVADNASSDDSISFLKEHFSSIRLIQNIKNFGFAQGYNEALAQIDAEYFVLINSDVEVTQGWIEGIIDFMDTHLNIAACQPKILSFKNKNMFEYAGAAGGFIDKLGYPFCRGRLFQSLEADNNQYNDIKEIFWATGACMFVRASHFNEMGGFDNDFFAHMEEIDLCWRLKNKGYSIFYYPFSTVFHVGGATLDKMSPQKTYLNFRNNLSLIYKNMTGRKLRITLFIRCILDLVAAVSFLSSGGFKHMNAVFRAYVSFYQKRKLLHAKRIKIEQKPVSCIYQKSIVKSYYLNKFRSFSLLSESDFSK